jgi:formiminoglutamase
MKDLSIYFREVDTEIKSKEGTIGKSIEIYTQGNFPELKKNSIAIIYVPEFRNGEENFQNKQNENFRKFFYELYVGTDWNKKIFDCGTILPGKEISDTYFALTQVVSEMIKNDIIPIIIGGTQDLTYSIYKGYEKLEQMVNICSIDHKLDIGNPEENISKDGYLSHLLTHRPCFLFNHANIGCQAPLVSKTELDLFNKLFFDICRLGEFNSDFKKAEPHIRNADILSIDLQSIKKSDFNANIHYSPNGFTAEQMCQIAKYGGISDKLTSLGLFNYYPNDNLKTSEHLIAQIMWYFIDGVNLRKGDFPIGSKKDYLKFSVHLEEYSNDLVFYKSNKSNRWWIEVPYPNTEKSKYERHHLVPCNHEDYELAMNNEIPDIWWKTYQKLS